MKMNRERLEVLADFLEALDPKQIRMDFWFDECGTVACAGGWACRIPEFQAAGLRTSYDPSRADDIYSCPTPVFSDEDGEWDGYEALGAFFGLWNPYWLFDPDEYRHEHPVTGTVVANRIRSLLAEAERDGLPQPSTY